MSKKDLIEQAAVKALSRPAISPTPITGNISQKKQSAASLDKKDEITSGKVKKTAKPSVKSKTPEKGSAEAEAHKLAALASTIRLSEPEIQLPQKGSAEAAVHRLAAQEAAEKSSGSGSGSGLNIPTEQGSGLGFLFLVLALPLAILAGLYAYASNNSDKTDKTILAQADRAKVKHENATGKMIEQGLTNPLMANPGKDRRRASREEPKPVAPPLNTAKPAPTPVTKTASHAAAKSHRVHWDYKSTNWAALSPAFKACGEGRSQSPIDIQAASGPAGPNFQFNYFPSSGKIHNNGHTLQVDLIKGKQRQSNQLLVNGKPYDLIQFHFHTPSENRINGTSFPMEVHLVHKNAEDQLAVVAVMITSGVPNQLIDQMPVPATKGQYAMSSGAHINPMMLLPNDRRSYTFSGSLTTPPCTQNVGWIVLKTPLFVSGATLTKFQKILGKNNRPVQPSNGRKIFSSN